MMKFALMAFLVLVVTTPIAFISGVSGGPHADRPLSAEWKPVSASIAALGPQAGTSQPVLQHATLAYRVPGSEQTQQLETDILVSSWHVGDTYQTWYNTDTHELFIHKYAYDQPSSSLGWSEVGMAIAGIFCSMAMFMAALAELFCVGGLLIIGGECAAHALSRKPNTLTS